MRPEPLVAGVRASGRGGSPCLPEVPDTHDLLFVDGPLRGRTHLDRTIGFINAVLADFELSQVEAERLGLPDQVLQLPPRCMRSTRPRPDRRASGSSSTSVGQLVEQFSEHVS